MVTPVIFLKHSLHVVSTFLYFEDNTLFFYKYLNFLFEYVQDLLEHISGPQETVSPDIQIDALKIKVSVERIPHTSFLQPTSRCLDIELNKAVFHVVESQLLVYGMFWFYSPSDLFMTQSFVWQLR